MADEKKRDWIDIVDVISKVLIPVVIAYLGIAYSARPRWRSTPPLHRGLDLTRATLADRITFLATQLSFSLPDAKAVSAIPVLVQPPWPQQ